ncbi:MAG: 50S ribosomal protein L3 [Candidatus Obscuribacterales bacterium]|nr:50S ribosomal protein L3 [Candidatus Obscuribacterales bacterium]
MKNSVGLLGKKVGMTQVFDKEGGAVPVTVVQLGANVVTQTMTKEKNGYSAVQIGGFAVKEKKLNKPELGAMKKQELPALKPLREFRVADTSSFKVGEELKADELLKEGMLIDVQGTSIGKGFQGTIKRYNAGRGPMSHGSKFHRSMGSIGPGTTPGRVFKGLHMPGHMGSVTCKVTHLKVVKVDTEKRLLLVRGSVPGCDGGLLVITPSITKWNG